MHISGALQNLSNPEPEEDWVDVERDLLTWHSAAPVDIQGSAAETRKEGRKKLHLSVSVIKLRTKLQCVCVCVDVL